MTSQLAIVKIDKKQYYQDDRLQEYREVKNNVNRIPFDGLGNRKVELVQPKKEFTKDKGQRLR